MSSCPDCGCSIPIPGGESAIPDARCLACAEVAEAQAAQRRLRTGLIMLGCTVGLVLIMVLMLRTGFDVETGTGDEADSLFVLVFMAAVSLLGVGLSQLPRLRRRLKT